MLAIKVRGYLKDPGHGLLGKDVEGRGGGKPLPKGVKVDLYSAQSEDDLERQLTILRAVSSRDMTESPLPPFQA